MNWQDKGYLLSIIKYNENSSIAEFFTKKFGKTSGIIFGSTSKKIKNYLFIGNKFHINYTAKNENSIGSFKIEIESVKTPLYLEEKLKFFCIIYSINIIRTLSVENQKNLNIYSLLENLFILLKNKNFFKNFIYWELDLLKSFGYELNFSDHTTQIKSGNKLTYVSKSDKDKVIPNFLIEKNLNNITNNNLIIAFEIVGDFLKKSIFNDGNLSIPNERNDIIKILQNL